MYAEIDKFDNQMSTYVEYEDMCYICTHSERCPLLGAIQEEVVVLRYDHIGIGKCGLYKEFCFDELIAF